MNWQDVWTRKGTTTVPAYDLQTLIALDGFDSGAGRLSVDGFRRVAAYVRRYARRGTRLLDVGCGAGALLWCLRDAGLALLGVDYSATLIAHARRAAPEARLAVAEAARLPFDADFIVAHSVFQYFPDLAYADRVLAEFRHRAPAALILDVPDAERREDAERARATAGSKPGRHLYYPRTFFRAARITDVTIPGYGNAPFRFNAYLRWEGRKRDPFWRFGGS